MAQRPKRKFDYFEQDPLTSTAAMSQANLAGPSRNPVYYNDLYEPIEPRPDLQELYNNWRQLEEQEELRVHLQEQAQLRSGSSDGGQHNAFLRPPSPSATSMSRSPSCASTSNSVTGAINNMGLSDEKPTKRKQGRHGPLGAIKKARTALLRKLHACQTCHDRKVACLHHNFSLLEDAFQASKQRVPHPPRRLRQNNTENTRAQQQDLFGVGERPNLNLNIFPPYQAPFFGAGSGQEDPNVDFQNLLGQTSPMSPHTTAPLYTLSDPLRWQNIGFPFTNNTISPAGMTSLSPSYPYPASFSPSVSPISALPKPPRTAATDPITDRHMPIGRRIVPENGQGQGYLAGQYGDFYGTRGTGEREWEWECRFGDDGTLSSCSYSNMSDSNEAPIICKQRCGTLESLKTHFQKEHLPFENGKIYPFCTLCSQHYDYALFDRCPTCRQGGDPGLEAASLASPFSSPYSAGNRNSIEQSQEQWYWGDVLPAPDHGSGQRRTGRVQSEDGGLDGGLNFGSLGLARSGTITQLDVWNKAFGGSSSGGAAAAQGRSRGNFSCSMPPQAPDFSGSPSSQTGGDLDKHGNSGHSYRNPFVNLVLSPSPPPSLKPATSKMPPPFVAPLSHQMLSSFKKYDALGLSCPTSPHPNTPKRTPPTRGRARSCPYYAYGKELFDSRRSRSLKKEISYTCDGLSISLSSDLPWSTKSGAGILIDSSNTCHSTASNLTTTLIKLLLLVLTLLAFTHGLSSSSSLASPRSALPTGGHASWGSKNMPLLPLSSHARDTSANQIFGRAVICILLGLVGMWLVRRNLSFRRVLLVAGKDELRSRRQVYQREQDLSGLITDLAGYPRRQSLEGPFPATRGNNLGSLDDGHCHGDEYGYCVHVQVIAAATG